MQDLTERGLAEGAIGLATGLDYFPGGYADTHELIALSGTLAAHKGLYTAHVRYSLGLAAALHETFEIAQETGVSIHVSHFFGDGPEFDLMESARERGMDITFDSYPYASGLTALSSWLPAWAQEGSPAEILARLGESTARRRLATEFARAFRPKEEWDGYLFSGIHGERFRDLLGKSLREVVGTSEGELANLVCEILVEEKLGASLIDFWLSEDQVRRSLRHPLQMVASDGVYTHHPHPRGFGTFPRVLARYAREARILTLEDAIRRMTSFPAERFGLCDRGRVAVGKKADLAIFDFERLEDRATYQEPELPPEGIVHVLVNGGFAVENGRRTAANLGRVLRSLGVKGHG
jgi:N-acyl-D-amino-acid deacylase